MTTQNGEAGFASRLLERIIEIFVALTIFYIGQVYAERLTYWRSTTSNRLNAYRDLIEVASEIIVDLDGDLASSSTNLTQTDAALKGSMRRFEILYWGRSGLVVDPEISGCIKNLRNTFKQEVQGLHTVSDHDQEIRLMRVKLLHISSLIRKEYDNAYSSVSLFSVLKFSPLTDNESSPACP